MIEPYCPLEVGMKCICIEESMQDSRHSFGSEKFPVIGKIYTVREVLISPRGNPHIRLVEIRNRPMGYTDLPGEKAFLAHRFRPVRNIDATDEVEAMKKLMRDAVKTQKVSA